MPVPRQNQVVEAIAPLYGNFFLTKVDWKNFPSPQTRGQVFAFARPRPLCDPLSTPLPKIWGSRPHNPQDLTPLTVTLNLIVIGPGGGQGGGQAEGQEGGQRGSHGGSHGGGQRGGQEGQEGSQGGGHGSGLGGGQGRGRGRGKGGGRGRG